LLLYNLLTDPGEKEDLSAREPQRTREMASELLAWQKEQLLYYGSSEAMREYYAPMIGKPVAKSEPSTLTTEEQTTEE
jgi:hypothetical protein